MSKKNVIGPSGFTRANGLVDWRRIQPFYYAEDSFLVSLKLEPVQRTVAKLT